MQEKMVLRINSGFAIGITGLWEVPEAFQPAGNMIQTREECMLVQPLMTTVILPGCEAVAPQSTCQPVLPGTEGATEQENESLVIRFS